MKHETSRNRGNQHKTDETVERLEKGPETNLAEVEFVLYAGFQCLHILEYERECDQTASHCHSAEGDGRKRNRPQARPLLHVCMIVHCRCKVWQGLGKVWQWFGQWFGKCRAMVWAME